MNNQITASDRKQPTHHVFFQPHSVPEKLDELEKDKMLGIYIQLSGDVGPWLEKLCDFPKLEVLSFSHCHGNNLSDQWDELKKFKTLKSLEIHDCDPLNQTALDSIAELENLKRLWITSQVRENETDFSVLAKLRSLQTLELGFEQVNGYIGLWAEELDFIRDLPALEHLLLRDNCHLCAAKLLFPPSLKVLSVPSHTPDSTIKSLQDSGIIVMGAW